MSRKHRNYTPEQAAQVVARHGSVEVNPLRAFAQRPNCFTRACFAAHKKGLLHKRRINCGRYVFTPTGK